MRRNERKRWERNECCSQPTGCELWFQFFSLKISTEKNVSCVLMGKNLLLPLQGRKLERKKTKRVLNFWCLRIRERERENSNQVKLWCYGAVKMDAIWFIIITSWFRYFNLLVHDGMMREIIRSVEYEFEKLWMREKKNEKKRKKWWRNERKKKRRNDEKSIKRVWAWKKIEQNFYDSWKNVRHSFLFRQKRVKKKVCACENDMTF